MRKLNTSGWTPKERYENNSRTQAINYYAGERQPHAKGDIVKPGRDDPCDSDRSDPGTDDESDDILSDKLRKHHIVIDRGQSQHELAAEAQRIARARNVDRNTILAMTPKWYNRFKRDLAKPAMQAQIATRQNTETTKPI